MAVIQAQEVFYSRVEAPYSTLNKSGYQVVYHSPSLDKSTVKEIENHLRCFESSQGETRYQFFHLTSGAVALAVSQVIDPVNTRITDRAGRPGPFLAHCIVLQPQDFLLLDNDPFRLFDEFDVFILDVEEMIEVQQRQPATRDIEIEVVDAQEEAQSIDYFDFDITDWKKESFLRLWALAEDASAITISKRSVTVQAQEGIESLLRLFMAHLNVEQRFFCTFNTFVDGCEPSSGLYWMLGGTRRAKQSNAIRINLDRRDVSYDGAHMSAAMKEKAETLFAQLRESQIIDDE